MACFARATGDWYISPVLDDKDCKFVADHMSSFRKAYTANSPVFEDVPDALVETIVDELTFTGDLGDVDRMIERFWTFKNAGVNEMRLRLYDEPADSSRLIAETIGPDPGTIFLTARGCHCHLNHLPVVSFRLYRP